MDHKTRIAGFGNAMDYILVVCVLQKISRVLGGKSLKLFRNKIYLYLRLPVSGNPKTKFRGYSVENFASLYPRYFVFVDLG